MTRGILMKTLRDLRGGLIGWGISLACTAALLIYIYPSFSGAETVRSMQQMLDTSGPALKVFYGRFVDMTTLEGFLALEGFNMFLPVLFLVYAAITGASLVGGEEERGTLDLLLSYPIPRWRLVVDKFLALLAAIAALAAATALGFVLGGVAAGVKANYGLVVAASMNMVPLTLLFGAVAFLVTCAGWGRGLAGGLAGVLATAAYLVDVLAPMVKGLDGPSRYLPFYLYGGGLPLKEGVSLGHVAALLAAAVALAGIGLWAFQRRDVGT